MISVSNETVYLLHEQAFERQGVVLDALRKACADLGFEPSFLIATPDELTLEEAVGSYLFNSQIVTLPSGGMALILPVEVEETPRAKAYVDRVVGSNGPIREAHYLDLRQSMRNGGGPACLRLRVVMTEDERNAIGADVLVDEAKIAKLEEIVRKRYRDRLLISDLADPALLDESRTALDEIAQTLGLGAIYDFQRA